MGFTDIDYQLLNDVCKFKLYLKKIKRVNTLYSWWGFYAVQRER